MGQTFFVLVEGLAAVSVGGLRVRTLSAAGWFGEIALMHEVPRTATVTALRPCLLWTLERAAFREILAEAAGGQEDLAAAGVGLLV